MATMTFLAPTTRCIAPPILGTILPDCPNESVALPVLRLAFDRVGLAALSVRTTVIASQEQAQERGFVGSPTILINGVDPFGHPRVNMRIRRHAGVSMTLEILANARADGDARSAAQAEGSPFDAQVNSRLRCCTCPILLLYWQQERPSPNPVGASGLRKHWSG
jgi:hypothetical protein